MNADRRRAQYRDAQLRDELIGKNVADGIGFQLHVCAGKRLHEWTATWTNLKSR
jgi:hypothetical protein